VARFIPWQTDWWGTLWKLLVFLAVIIGAILVIEPRRGWAWTIVFILGGLWVFVGLVSRRTGYKCGNCGRNFQVPTTVNFFTPSQVGKNEDGTYYSCKKLTCPYCKKTTKARLMKRSETKGSGKLLR